MTKEEWYKVGENKHIASNVLFNEKCFHNSVYLGGYVLESYFKLILIIDGWDADDLFVHLNASKGKGRNKIEEFLYKEVNKIYTLKPELFEGFDFQNVKNLLHGEDRWSVHDRYDPQKWNTESFCKSIKAEIDYVMGKLNYLKLEGELV